MNKFFARILDFIFPPSCPVCGVRTNDNGTLCPECWATFNWISDPKCSVCGYPFPADLDLGARPMCPVCAAQKNEVDWMRAACVYDDASRGVMLPFKHAAALKYRDMMSRAMINCLHELPQNAAIDLVLPVPLAWARLFHRGYNQAALLARPIAGYLHVPMDTASVRRKYKSDMGHKNARQRREHIRGVFRVRTPKNIAGKNILLVDDVFTSGATFSELRKTLRRAGAKNVYGIVFCRVVRAI